MCLEKKVGERNKEGGREREREREIFVSLLFRFYSLLIFSGPCRMFGRPQIPLIGARLATYFFFVNLHPCNAIKIKRVLSANRSSVIKFQQISMLEKMSNESFGTDLIMVQRLAYNCEK
jgi:hypothetical protein